MAGGYDEWRNKFCGVGDCIETTFSDGRIVRLRLDTPEAAATANEFLMRNDGMWRKVILDNNQPKGN